MSSQNKESANKQQPSGNESQAPSQCFPHSHDSMYLVTHLGDGVVYESCHHCSFIRVPELETLRGWEARYRVALGKIRDRTDCESMCDCYKIAREALHPSGEGEVKE